MRLNLYREVGILKMIAVDWAGLMVEFNFKNTEKQGVRKTLPLKI
jgi:hypothetical protein